MNSIADILKEAHILELISKKNSVSILDGHFKTNISGRGTEFREARKYMPGESVRLIDWNMTARLGEPHVKIFQEERERNIIIALDVSPSMNIGWQEKTKLEYSIEIAASLVYSGIDSGDRVGFLFFQDKILKEIHPKRGRKNLHYIMSELVRYRSLQPRIGKTDIRSAIHAIQKQKGTKFVVFILSDFIDLDIPDDLRYLAKSHDVSLLHVYDRMEFYKSRFLRFHFQDPEDSENSSVGNLGSQRSMEDQGEYLERLSRRYNVHWGNFPTHEKASSALLNFFQKKRGRRS